MAKCEICNSKIKPWFSECFDCHQMLRSNKSDFPQTIAHNFMEYIGMNGWKVR